MNPKFYEFGVILWNSRKVLLKVLLIEEPFEDDLGLQLNSKP